MLEAGELDRRIELFRKDSAEDEYNSQVVTWVSLGKIWAGTEDRVEDEGVLGGQLAANVTTFFRIRYRPDIRPDHTMKVEFEGQEYLVVRVRRLAGRGSGFELACRLQDRTGSRGL